MTVLWEFSALTDGISNSWLPLNRYYFYQMLAHIKSLGKEQESPQQTSHTPKSILLSFGSLLAFTGPPLTNLLLYILFFYFQDTTELASVAIMCIN